MPTKKVVKKKENIIRGKKARAAGGRFELKVRADLEKLGWIVSKWMNTVEYEKDGGIPKLVPAKRKYNPFLKALGIGTGFPDFVVFKKNENFVDVDGIEHDGGHEVIGVEVKANGYLDKIEKDMCHFLLERKIFPRILIARKSKERGKIDYDNFGKKYKLKGNKA